MCTTNVWRLSTPWHPQSSTVWLDDPEAPAAWLRRWKRVHKPQVKPAPSVSRGDSEKKTKNPWSTRVAEVVLWWRIELLQMMILMIFASCKLFGVPKVSEVKNEYRVCRLDYMYWTSLQGTSLQVGSLVQRLDRLCESKSHSTSSTVWTKLWKPWHTKTLPIIAIA
jgi:hypothetical protein